MRKSKTKIHLIFSFSSFKSKKGYECYKVNLVAHKWKSFMTWENVLIDLHCFFQKHRSCVGLPQLNMKDKINFLSSGDSWQYCPRETPCISRLQNLLGNRTSSPENASLSWQHCTGSINLNLCVFALIKQGLINSSGGEEEQLRGLQFPGLSLPRYNLTCPPLWWRWDESSHLLFQSSS